MYKIMISSVLLILSYPAFPAEYEKKVVTGCASISAGEPTALAQKNVPEHNCF